MKKLFKAFLILVLINFIGTVGVFTWFGVSIFKDSGITFSDLYNKELDPVKKANLEINVNETSSELGKKAAEKLINCLKVIIPTAGIDFSKMPEAPYPYPSSLEVLEMQNKIANEGAAEGLRILKESEEKNKIIKKKALEDAQRAVDSRSYK